MYPYQSFNYGFQPRDGSIQNVGTVQSKQEAENLICPAGSRVLVMDANEALFYVKETDWHNVSSIKTYKFEEVISSPMANGDYVTTEQFSELEQKYESLIQKLSEQNCNADTNPSTAEQHISDDEVTAIVDSLASSGSGATPVPTEGHNSGTAKSDTARGKRFSTNTRS